MNNTKQDFNNNKLLTQNYSNKSIKEPFSTFQQGLKYGSQEKEIDSPEKFYLTIKPTDDETMKKILDFADINEDKNQMVQSRSNGDLRQSAYQSEFSQNAQNRFEKLMV